MEHIVGIGEYAMTNDPSDVIKTFALATCVGLVFYSMRRRCMAMAHIQLPNAKDIKTEKIPSRFADAAPGFLYEEMSKRYGLTRGELLISLYGGVNARGEHDCFKIGEKNISTVKTVLRTLGLVYSDVDTGGAESRTLVAHVSSGIVEVIKRPMAMRTQFLFNK